MNTTAMAMPVRFTRSNNESHQVWADFYHQQQVVRYMISNGQQGTHLFEHEHQKMEELRAKACNYNKTVNA